MFKARTGVSRVCLGVWIPTDGWTWKFSISYSTKTGKVTLLAGSLVLPRSDQPEDWDMTVDVGLSGESLKRGLQGR